ncbi:MAG: cobalt-precorrin-5B (C(1))-methyltransferase [Janthinobacterium lividum]
MTDTTNLRRGWTTGACAAAAAKAAYAALLTGAFPDPVEIPLPRGGRTAFALAEARLEDGGAHAGIVKDAGDDPDVTHGALIRVRVVPGGDGLRFRAGPGVGMITRPGLPLPVGEPAINPGPRGMILAAMSEVRAAPDALVEIGVEHGERLAERTLNGRLGIVGGLSILGTTGIVVPYSCAAWIDTIHRGIDVARAMGLTHVAGTTGSTSEAAIAALHGLPEVALLEMGDFAGGLLKYLRTHPVPQVSIAGGVAKMTKLAQGRLDLHSKRGSADMPALAALAPEPVRAAIAGANTVAEAFLLWPGLGDEVAAGAWRTAAAVLAGSGTALEVVLFDREGRMRGRSGFRTA